MLPFQLIYKGKTKRSLPTVEFPEGFSLSYNERHWSNEKESLKLLKEVINPYVEKVREEMGLPIDQKALLIWDAFRGQQSQPITDALEDYSLVTVMVPKNLTHLLQPLDLTTNGSFKKMERAAFRDYFTNTIMKELESDPEKDVTTIKVDLKLSTLKPIHAKLMNEIYQHFKQAGRQTILNGWKSAGVVRAVADARSGAVAEFNPFA